MLSPPEKFLSDISKNGLGTFLNVVIILLGTSEEPKALVIKSLGFGVSISDFDFNSFSKTLSLGFLTAMLVSSSWHYIEDQMCNVLGTALHSVCSSCSSAAFVVFVLIITYYTTSRTRDGFTKKPAKLKFQGLVFLGPFQCPVPNSVFSILRYCLKGHPHLHSSSHCISSRPCRT